MKPLLPLLPLLLLGLAGCQTPISSPPSASAGHGPFNVLDYGAVPDGVTNDTAAFARVVAAAHAAGGGTIVVPAGRYLTGSIELESNITLDLEAGSALLYSPNPADSPLVASRWEDTTAYTHAPLIHADHKQNIAIVGRGTLDGQGRNWWWRAWGRAPAGVRVDPAQLAAARAGGQAYRGKGGIMERVQAGEKLSRDDFKVAAEFLRPSLIEPDNCQNFVIDGVTITESPMWMFHPLYSDNITVHGVTFLSDGPNTDGIDVDSCRDVRISDCWFRTGDDCIVIKSGKDADGRRIGRPTEHVVVTNCTMYEGHGCIVIGSETSGDIRDVAATNIVGKGTDTGLRIKSQRGRGGVVENVRISNFVLENIRKQAIEITTLYTRNLPPEPLSVRTPVFRNIAVSNVTVINANQVASIQGLAEKAIEGLRFTDISATGKVGFLCDHADGIELHHVRVSATSGSAFAFDQVHNLVLDDVGSDTPVAGAPVVRLARSDSIWLRDSRAAAGTGTFLETGSPRPASLLLTDNDLSRASAATAP
ncbi:MAG TPA: glycoside hydrolase family 28 protein [Opitutaceae bacterium]|nr:glycoside hydrolase family 28 protein [Opitutaceae bacterium]